MKVTIILLIAMVVLTLPFIEARAPGCTAFTVPSTTGRLLGNCHAPDETGSFFCYARKGTPACVGQKPSTTFPLYCHAHAPCRLYVHPFATSSDDA